jgi:subtilase family serine protease
MSLLAALVPSRIGPRVFAAPARPKGLAHYVPEAVTGGLATFLGRRPASESIQVAVGLPLRNADALNRLLAEGAPGRRPLTQAEANAEFNPTADQETRVESWLRAHGFTVTDTYPNHLLVDARGTVGAAERMLHVTLNDYTVALHGRGVRFLYRVV